MGTVVKFSRNVGFVFIIPEFYFHGLLDSVEKNTSLTSIFNLDSGSRVECFPC